MAFQFQQQRGGQHARRTSFVHMRDAYHGDTIGSVSVGGIDLFHSTYRPLLFEAHAAEPGDAADLERVLSCHEEEIAAVIVEPLVQGAAGMLVHPPGYLRAVRELCDRFGVLLICDEVATGFGRTGTMFACEQEDVAPDLLCLAKGLTGGYLPLAATLATERIYDGFLGAPEEQRTFFHGHTYTGNPLACAAALASLEAFERERTLERLQPKIALLGELLEAVAAMPQVAEVRSRGVMVGIDLGAHDPALRLGHRVTLEARKRGAIIRPLGDVVVLMPPLSISDGGAAPPGRDHGRVDRGGVRVGSAAAECGRAGASRLKESTLQPSRCDGIGPARSTGVSEAIVAPTEQPTRARETGLVFEQLYRASRDDVYAYVAGLLRDRVAAEEVTAAAFERAYRKRSRFDSRRGSARAWLFGIARNAALDELRRPRPAGATGQRAGATRRARSRPPSRAQRAPPRARGRARRAGATRAGAGRAEVLRRAVQRRDRPRCSARASRTQAPGCTGSSAS